MLSYFYLACFVGGLLLLVAYMFFGVERRPRSSSSAVAEDDWRAILGSASEIRARIGGPSLAAFGSAFGSAGYALTSQTGLHPAWVALLAAICGSVALLAVILIVAAWAVPSARRAEVDERYVLQGQLATVTAAVGADTPGSISLVVGNSRFTLPALSLDGVGLEAGTEVVIERVEDDVAYVERWARVEERL